MVCRGLMVLRLVDVKQDRKRLIRLTIIGNHKMIAASWNIHWPALRVE